MLLGQYPGDKMVLDARQSLKPVNHAQVKIAVRETLRSGKFFKSVRTPEYKAVVSRKSQLDVDALIAGHDKNIKDKTNLLKFQAKTQVSIVQGWCVKTYKKSRMLTQPYAVRSWKGLMRLFFYGVPVAQPGACIVFKDGSSMLVTKALSEPSLDKLLFHEYENFDSRTRHAIAARLGELIGSMHARGIYHADLKACNILAEKAGLHFFITDTDRVVLYKTVPPAKRINNLMQIHLSIPKHVSPRLRMRFLKSYTERCGDDAKALFTEMWQNSRGAQIVYTTQAGDKFESWDS